MKSKLIMPLLAAMLCVGNAQAQQQISRKTQWSIAPRAGVNFATCDVETGWMTGFHADVLGQCLFDKVWALEFGISYSREGSAGANSRGERNVMNVPVTAKAYIWRGLNLSLGGEFAVDFPSNMGGSGAEPGASVVMGLGYEMPSGLLFAFNYNYGTYRFGRHLSGPSYITQVCQLSVGWRFGLSKTNKR